MDRRQIDDVEAHGGEGGQPLGGGAQRAADRPPPLGHHGPLRAREELVPGAEQRPLPVHLERHGARGGDQLPQRVAVEGLGHIGRERGGEPVGDRAALVAQRVDGGQDRLPAVVLGHSGGGPLMQPGALLQDQLGVDPGRDLDPGVVAPGGDRIAPCLDRVRPAAAAAGGDLGAPAVGAGGEFAHRGPGARAPGGSRRTTLASTASWPSRKTVALTSKVSPPTALAGRLPQSISGRISRMGMRPIIGSPDGVADGDARAAFVLCIGFAAGRWVAGMTAPVRVHSGGRMRSAMGGARGKPSPVERGGNPGSRELPVRNAGVRESTPPVGGAVHAMRSAATSVGHPQQTVR